MEYLKKLPYGDYCKVVEFPTKGENRRILDVFSNNGNHLFCVHGSLRYFNDELQLIEGSDRIKNNLISQIKSMGIKCIIFSRDITNNKKTLYIDKDLFYKNFKMFIDKWIQGVFETDILYDGTLYVISNRKEILNEIINIVNKQYPCFESEYFMDLLKQYIPEEKPDKIIDLWKCQSYTKKEIRQFINDKL